MNEQAGVASHAGTFLPSVPDRTHIEVVRAWEAPPQKVSFKDSVSAGAFLVFYLAAYGAAGYLGVAFMEWAWMRVFG